MNVWGIDVDNINKYYKIYKIPKRKGGYRIIHEPNDELEKRPKMVGK